MEIDWITFSAQIVNLIVLIWLLKRFLYKPVLKAIDDREKSISDRVNGAKELEKKAKEQIKDLQSKKEDFEKERYALLAKTKDECEALRERMLDEAKAEVKLQKDIWLSDIEKQKAAFFDSANHGVIKSFMHFADKALRDLAESGLEKQMTEIFKNKIAALPAADKKSFTENANESGKVTVTTTFALQNAGETEKFIRDTFNLGNDVRICFENNEQLICGIELSSKEKSLSWSMKEHLNQFKAELKSALSGE